MKKFYSDRSRIETTQRCARRRWHEYHDGPDGIGIQSKLTPLPLAVGGSVHEGLAVLLEGGQQFITERRPDTPEHWLALENKAVKVALADFATFAGGALEIDLTELSEMVEGVATTHVQLTKQKSAFDEFLYKEQSALVEAFVRGYARRRLRPLLEQFEILEVEREGSWLLSQWYPGQYVPLSQDAGELIFNSRPDALLLERDSRQLYLLSFKSTGSWDVRIQRSAQHDMQGLSEGIEIEQRLGEWWEQLQSKDTIDPVVGRSKAMADYLAALSAPPRIHAVRYEYLYKHYRKVDDRLSEKMQLTVRTQQSLLVRAYLSQGMAAGDEQWNWSWGFINPEGKFSKLYYKNWTAAPVWEHMTIKEWIDKLDASTPRYSEEMPDLLIGYVGPAQSTGRTQTHPLDEVFLPPITVYRNDDDLRDLVEQMESQETHYVQAAEQVRAARDQGEKRHLLNTLFIQTRKSCHYPSDCPYVPICYGGEDIRRDPMSSQLYKIRTPNHPESQ